jgi:formylglycine-generating enzyme required for sulfatase activity
MVYVRGGWFEMGEAGGVDNPVHRVSVDDFWMAKHEVTAGEWRAFADSVGGVPRWGRSWFTQQVGKSTSFRVPDDWAMFALTWYEAIWYCNWKSEQEGLEPAYGYDDAEMRELLFGRGEKVTVAWNREANGYRLPTEAEWEYAARGGPKAAEGAYPEGTALADISWYAENSKREVHPVGQKQPNVLGLYDVLGNVSEWCWDYYDAGYYPRSPERNPWGPDIWYDATPRDDSGEIRVSRGSSWVDTAKYSTEFQRFRPVSTNMTVIGIRLVRPIK